MNSEFQPRSRRLLKQSLRDRQAHFFCYARVLVVSAPRAKVRAPLLDEIVAPETAFAEEIEPAAQATMKPEASTALMTSGGEEWVESMPLYIGAHADAGRLLDRESRPPPEAVERTKQNLPRTKPFPAFTKPW